jgi:hypothetical protein
MFDVREEGFGCPLVQIDLICQWVVAEFLEEVPDDARLPFKGDRDVDASEKRLGVHLEGAPGAVARPRPYTHNVRSGAVTGARRHHHFWSGARTERQRSRASASFNRNIYSTTTAGCLMRHATSLLKT